jgi:hypothetical protein
MEDEKMKTIFEIALIVLCLIVFICPAVFPKEISGEKINGGCGGGCCEANGFQYCTGTYCYRRQPQM